MACRTTPRRIPNALRIEQRDIRSHPLLDEPAICQAERPRGKPGHLVDRRLEGEQADIARVVPEHAGKRAP